MATPPSDGNPVDLTNPVRVDINILKIMATTPSNGNPVDSTDPIPTLPPTDPSPHFESVTDPSPHTESVTDPDDDALKLKKRLANSTAVKNPEPKIKRPSKN